MESAPLVVVRLSRLPTLPAKIQPELATVDLIASVVID